MRSPSPPSSSPSNPCLRHEPLTQNRQNQNLHNHRHQHQNHQQQQQQEFIHYFNSHNAKTFAFAIVCGFVLYHSILRLSHGIDSCQWLLSDGNFRDQVWQPYGCMMHHYSQQDARRCLRYMEYWGGKNHFVFIGDTRTEQLYHSFIHQISTTYQEPLIQVQLVKGKERSKVVSSSFSSASSFSSSSAFSSPANGHGNPNQNPDLSVSSSSSLGNSRLQNQNPYINFNNYHTNQFNSNNYYQNLQKQPNQEEELRAQKWSKDNSNVRSRRTLPTPSKTNADRNNNDKLVSQDQYYNDSHLGLRVQYLWYPYPNKSMITALAQWKNGPEHPSVLVVSAGTWSIRSNNPYDAYVAEDYAASLTHLVVTIDRLAQRGTRVLWAMQEPVNEDKLSDDWAPLSNSLIDLYNDNAKKILRYSKADIWWSGRRVAAENLMESSDGYHLSRKTLFHDAQILLNMYCNDNMNYNDATCCSSSEPISNLQIVVFAILIISFALATVAIIRKRWAYRCGGLGLSGKGSGKMREYEFVSLNLKLNDHCSSCNNIITKPVEGFNYCLIALAKLALIMAYFFLCDRTTMFMKENKYFTQTNFWLPVVYILVLGIFFTEASVFTKVLHPDQDHETKGWMVLLILVYNMMGASQVVPIFMFVKILYSGFLFLHGYSQFSTYLQRGDYSVVRFLQDLFRLNVMTVLLCLCMNRPYQFYEFIPLVSFWTFVVYVGLSIPPRITWQSCESNSLNYLYLVFKLVGIYLFITILYMSEVFFEKVFVTRPWKALFVTTDDDIHEWWTRWKIDRYSMPCGMVLAFGYHLAHRHKILEDENHGNLFSTRISLSVILFSILGIGGYCIFSVFCRNQLECIEIHSYVGFIPVASYILLRNVSGMLRTRFSSFFGWFGEFWVELLVGQYHVWMGADGHGVLVLVPAYPVGNVLLTAFVYVCTAHEMRKCTDTLLPYAVPDDWRKALRNLFLFLLVLVPIGIHDGMF